MLETEKKDKNRVEEKLSFISNLLRISLRKYFKEHFYQEQIADSRKGQEQSGGQTVGHTARGH